jgi:lysophospholipase L1-like esterase
MEPQVHPTGPFRRMVVIGDSVSYGMCAFRPENEFPQVAASLLRRFQDEELAVLNRALPAEVISPRAPGYEESAHPSLIERYRQHCIELRPDLVLIAEGLNDMRSGMPLQTYMAELEQIVRDIQDETGALVVLVGIYHQVHGRGSNDPAVYPTWSRWDPEIAWLYNEAIRLVARRRGALFVDALATLNGADWTLNIDCCHLNDLGHQLIGNAVFQVIATSCQGIGDRTMREIVEKGIDITNTGGTDIDDEIRALWRAAAERFGA